MPLALRRAAFALGSAVCEPIDGVAPGRYRVVVSASSNPVESLRCADVLDVRPGDAETRFESHVLRGSDGR